MGKHKHQSKSKKSTKHKKTKHQSPDNSDLSSNDQEIVWTETSSAIPVKNVETHQSEQIVNNDTNVDSSSGNEEQCELFDLLDKTSSKNTKLSQSEMNKKKALQKQGQIRYARELNSFFRDDVNKKFIDNPEETRPSQSIEAESFDFNENFRETKSISDSELNTLHAKLIKAQMLGNKQLIEELEKKIKQIKENKSDNVNSSIRYKTKSTNSNEKVSEDKMSVKELFLKTKTISSGEEAMRFVASSSRIKSPDDEYEDVRVKKKAKLDVIGLDRVGFTKTDDGNGCHWCLDKFPKHLVLKFPYQLAHCFVALTPYKPIVPDVLQIISIEHTGPSSLNADRECWSEIRQVMRKMSSFFDQHFGCTLVFMETFFKYKNQNGNLSSKHFVIECVPIKKCYESDAKMIFHTEIRQLGKEWSMNQKLIKLEKNPITRKLPKGLPYFWVSIGPEFDGYAHIIEDEVRFDKNFGKNVMGGMVVPELFCMRKSKPITENHDEQLKRINGLKNKWRDFIS